MLKGIKVEGIHSTKTLITYQLGKGLKPLSHDLIEVKPFKIPVMRLVKCNRDGHHFTQAQLTLTLTVFQSISHQLFVPQGFKNLAEIIDSAK
jgi:hypothetical protein